MNIYLSLGYLILSSPFIGLFIYMWVKDGLKVALSVFALTALVFLLVVGSGELIQLGADS